MSHYRNRDLYIERMTEADLIKDFPADERLIGGLHAMQAYFASNQSSISIPVVRIMNAAHLCCAYMFHTTCSGDQREYDALLYSTLGSDRQLMYVALITTAAMLKQTDGFRARACRSLILEDRTEDFYEGVTLYERFLNSSAVHFSEDDFETDIMHEINALRTRNQELIYENTQLKTTITIMEDKYQQIIHTQNNQTNTNCTVYNAPVTINNYQAQQQAEPKQEKEETLTTIPPDFFCISPRFTEENIRERLNAELSLATSKIDYCRALYRLQHIGCINLNQYASDAQRAIVFNRFQSKFTLSASDFCKARLNK